MKMVIIQERVRRFMRGIYVLRQTTSGRCWCKFREQLAGSWVEKSLRRHLTGRDRVHSHKG